MWALGIIGEARAEIARAPEAPAKIEVQATAIDSFEARDPSRQRFGALQFRGGLELSSPYKHFGGISAIRVAADGVRFLAVSDQGRWWRGRILYDGKRPAGIADAEMAPLLGLDGRPLGSRRWYDSESLAEDGGIAYVGIERVNQIVRFDVGKHGLLARGEPIAVPPGIKALEYNKGLECLAMVPRDRRLGGTLVAISELTLDENGNHAAFLIGGASSGAFAIKRLDDYAISDCAFMPEGDLLVLERRASLLRGLSMRIRRLSLSALAPNAVLDGPVLIEADMGYQIDNMEGLSVHRSAEGEVVLTLVSDDNFSLIQRTILLQFTLIEN